MSRQIDLTKELSAEDRQYLVDRADQASLDLNAQLTGATDQAATPEPVSGENNDSQPAGGEAGDGAGTPDAEGGAPTPDPNGEGGGEPVIF